MLAPYGFPGFVKPYIQSCGSEYPTYITYKETKQAILHHLLLQIQEEFLVFQCIIIHLQVQTVKEYSIELAHLKANKDKAVQVLHCFSILIIDTNFVTFLCLHMTQPSISSESPAWFIFSVW